MKNNRRKKIRPIYVSFLATLLTAAFLLNLVYLLYFSYSARKLDQEERARSLNQTVYYVNHYMGELESSADLLSISSTIQKLLTHRIKKNYLDYLDCSEAISEYSMTVPKIYRIDFYTASSCTLVTSSEGVFYDLTAQERKTYEQYMESDEKWFMDIHYAGKEPGLVSKNRNEEYVSLIKPVYSKYTGKKTGVLCISVRIAELEQLMPQTTDPSERVCMYYKGETVLGTENEPSGVQRIQQVSDYMDMSFAYDYRPAAVGIFNWKYMATMMLIIVFFAGIFLVIVRISERRMFDPVKQLLDGFHQMEKGNFNLRLTQERNDIFGELFYGFNHMAEQLQKMIDQLSEERAHRNEIKFRLLQMQIKPHFLYNLFNNMIWMMEQKDYEKLEVLIQSTAGYYKTALNFGNRDILLMDNRRQLECYGEIQKIRFGDRFTLQVDFPEELQFYSIPNLLLQPLVENAIVHGTDGAEKICHIQVSARTEGAYLVLTVADDGCGITQEELADIRKEVANYEEDGKKYVALVNISARLHTLYKGHADFHIDSSLNGGTRIILKLPLEEVNKICIV